MAPEVSILVVDDEPALVRLMTAYLERLGYHVEAAGNSTEALARFQSEPDRFSVVIADLTLPDMRGDELGMRLLELNPAVRILLCSGYPFEIDSLPAEVRPGFSQLQKPFVPTMLADTIAKLVAKR